VVAAIFFKILVHPYIQVVAKRNRIEPGAYQEIPQQVVIRGELSKLTDQTDFPPFYNYKLNHYHPSIRATTPTADLRQ
jgi:hypothetical protein